MNSSTATAETISDRVDIGTILATFLRLGCTSFGGPIAHRGYFREESVVRRRWLEEGQFAEMIALAQTLPGPASGQVGFTVGLVKGGWPGALAAFLLLAQWRVHPWKVVLLTAAVSALLGR